MRIILATLLLASCATTAGTNGTSSSAEAKASGDIWTPQGSYIFEANAQKNGRSVCIETWKFNTDGIHITYSGEQIVNYNFRTSKNDAGTLLFTKKLSSNGKPDCLGKIRSTKAEEKEFTTLINVVRDNIIMTCFPTGTLLRNEGNITNCFGSLIVERDKKDNQL